MLSERPWRLEAVMGLLAALMLGMVATSLLSLALTKLLSGHKFAQFVINTLCFQGLALVLLQVFLIYHNAGWTDFLGLNRTRVTTVLWSIVAVVIVLPTALALNNICAVLLTKIRIYPEEQVSMQALQVSVTVGQRIVFGIGAILLAPIVEESLFRGVFYPTVKQMGYPRTAVFGSSLLFALIHFNLMTFVPLFLLALVLVWLLETTDTLIAPILAHACFNGANFFIYINQNEIIRWWNELLRMVRPLGAS